MRRAARIHTGLLCFVIAASLFGLAVKGDAGSDWYYGLPPLPTHTSVPAPDMPPAPVPVAADSAPAAAGNPDGSATPPAVAGPVQTHIHTVACGPLCRLRRARAVLPVQVLEAPVVAAETHYVAPAAGCAGVGYVQPMAVGCAGVRYVGQRTGPIRAFFAAIAQNRDNRRAAGALNAGFRGVPVRVMQVEGCN